MLVITLQVFGRNSLSFTDLILLNNEAPFRSGRWAPSLRRRCFGHFQTGLRLCLNAMPLAAPYPKRRLCKD